MNKSVGEHLRQVRQERNISLEQVSAGTRIRLHYLKAIEEGEFERLPSAVQARGFVRAYANYLNLDPESVLISLSDQPPEPREAKPTQQKPTIRAKIPPMNDAEGIFADIGRQLKEQREILGLSLEDVARQTRLQVYYLRALEAGDLDELPSPVQGRGMLNNYAAFLGLDPNSVLLRFAEGLQVRRLHQQATRPRPKEVRQRSTRISPLRRWISADIILGGVLILVVALFVGWAAVRVNAIRKGELPTPTVLSIADALLPASESTNIPSPSVSAEAGNFSLTGSPPPTEPAIAETEEADEVEPTGEELISTENVGAVQIHITVDQRAWLRVVVDGETAFEGRVLRGAAYTFSGDKQIELLTGNGAALRVYFNQKDLGTLGIYGEVVHRIFTPEGILLPTPTISPTASPAPLETPAPEPNFVP